MRAIGEGKMHRMQHFLSVYFFFSRVYGLFCMLLAELAHLSPSVRQKLLKAGFSSSDDLRDLKPTQLAKEAKLTNEEAVQVLQLLHGRAGDSGAPVAQSAYAILEKQHTLVPIVTFCQALDSLLGGGISIGAITEICGVPGIGKTQLGMQLSLDVQIPACFGGVAGSAIYIDTEGSFVVARIREMAQALVRHLQELCNNPTNPPSDATRQAMEELTVDMLLDNVMYYRVHDFVEHLALTNVLPSYLNANRHKNVRLVVIDSMAFHFRHEFADFAQRARILQTLAQQLQALASQHSLAVVVMNQVTTKFKPNSESYLTPALGESWAHAVTHRLMLYMEDKERIAYLYKSPSNASRKAAFRIVSRGIRDLDRKRRFSATQG